MSQGTKNERKTQDLDLDKNAVTDITPKAEAVVADPIDPAPAEALLGGPNAPEEALPPPAAAVPPEARSKPSSALPVGAGAVAGALFGLLGSVVYQNVQQPPVTVADPRVAQVETAIAAVERRTADANLIEKRLLDQIKALEAKLAALDARATGLAEQAVGLEKRGAALDQKVAVADQRAAAVESRAATLISPVDDRLKAAEARLNDMREQASALGKRVDLLAQIEPPKVDLKPIIGKVEELEKSVASSAARVTLSGETMLSLDGRVKSVETSVKSIDTTSKAAEASLKGLEGAISSIKTRQPIETAAAVLGVTGLVRRAFDQGDALGPFTAALTALGVAPQHLAALAPYAEKPAPNATALAAQFDALAKTIKPASAPQSTSDSIVGRVTSGLWSQVEVRPVGNGAVDASGAAGKVRQALLAGNFSGALAAVSSLPAEQQAVLKPFTEAIQARNAALNALRGIESDALAITARKG